MVEEHRHLPDADRVSVLIAAILLAYALAQLVETQHYELPLSLLGVEFSLPLNLTTAATLLAAGLTATGMDWLLRNHPHFERENTFQHWLLPALTAFILGVPLYSLAAGSLGWWLSFALGGVILTLVFLSEYIVLDPSDVRYPAASVALNSLSFALFLILASALSYASARLFLMILAVFIASSMVSLRALHLRLAGRWEFAWASGIGLVCTQLAAALHYWPLAPLQFGLAILAPLYALTGLAINLGEDMSPRRAAIEAGAVLAIFWTAALLIRS
jgi:hypothetical protein